MRKLTTEEFIKRSQKIHENRYDYSLSIYKNRRTPIKIICKIHGVFEQLPDLHCNRGHGCDKCNGTFRLTTEEFIKRAQLVHDNKYRYDKVIYTIQKDRVEIFCPTHGYFFQVAGYHLSGRGCMQCYKDIATKQVFIEKAILVHNGKYDYSHVEYINSRTKVKIICPKHGEFWQQPNNHIHGAGCSRCADDNVSKARNLTHEGFINRANKIHGERYDYSEVIYIDIFTKIKIGCKEHGIFIQRPSDHLEGRGCPKCQASSGEIKISEILTKLGIRFTSEKRILKYRFDFHFTIGDKEFLIEYDGIQHFQNVEYWGKYGSVEKVKYRDAIKTKLAQDNGFTLIRIPYTEFDNIETIIKSELQKYT